MKQNNTSIIQQILGAIYLIKKGKRNQGLEVLQNIVKSLEVAV